MLMVRRIGSALLALAAIVVWFALEPEEPAVPSTASHSRSITQALEEFDLNNARAQGAPQQQVVNGWVARDLLSIVAEQQNDIIAAAAPAAADQRVPALLTLAVLSLALFGITTPTPAAAAPAAADVGAPSRTRNSSAAMQAAPSAVGSRDAPTETADVLDADSDSSEGQGRPS